VLRDAGASRPPRRQRPRELDRRHRPPLAHRAGGDQLDRGARAAHRRGELGVGLAQPRRAAE
jgi:hypothetical protein